MKKAPRPFPYFGEGIAMSRKFMHLHVAFREAVPEGERKGLQKGAPRVFKDFDWLSDALLQAGHGGSLQWEVAAKYPGRGPRWKDGEAGDGQWKAYNEEMDAWLLSVHKRHPLAFVIKPVDDEYSTALGAWHRWSSLDAGPELWPELKRVLGKDEDGLLEHVIGLWRADLAARPVAEQAKRLKALGKPVRGLLEDLGGVPKPVKKEEEPRELPIPKRLAALGKARGKGGDLEAAYAAEFPGRKERLSQLAYDLGEAGRWKESAELCAEALQTKVEFPQHYRKLRILALVRSGDLDSAEREIPKALLQAALYSDESLLVGWIELLEKRGRKEDAAAAYHLAASVGSYWKEGSEGAGLKRQERFGKSSAAVRSRSVALWEEWAGKAGPIIGLDLDTLSHAGHNAREVGSKSLEEACNAEWTRRHKIALELLLSKGELTAEASFFQALAERDLTPEEFDRVAGAVGQVKDRGQAIYTLADWALRHIKAKPAQAVRAYEELMKLPPPPKPPHRTNWLRALNNAIIVSWQVKNLDLSRRLADFAQPYAPENPYIYHSAACTHMALGDRARALEQTRLAVEYGYEKLDTMLTDADLGELLKDPEYLALFPEK